MIFIIDDDKSFCLSLQQIIGRPTRCFDNVISAISAMDKKPPEMIFLDVLLNGPDAFTLLNELASYSDLSQIPVILMSNLPFGDHDFSDYGIKGFLDKTKMTPKEIRAYVNQFCH